MISLSSDAKQDRKSSVQKDKGNKREEIKAAGREKKFGVEGAETDEAGREPEVIECE